MTGKPDNALYALIAYEDTYVQPLILSALRALVPASRLVLVEPPHVGQDEPTDLAALLPRPDCRVLQIAPYETLDFAHAAAHASTARLNSYVIRKALIRKHFLAATAAHWAAKHPEGPLQGHVARGEAFEVDYAEFLDDALVECFDLRASLTRNAGGADPTQPADDDGETGEVETEAPSADQHEWWILKPGMSDRAQGIRLFSTMEALQDIFDEWEEDEPSSDDGDDDVDGDAGRGSDDDGRIPEITTSHLRHFVAQPYIHPPLLLRGGERRKFHVRTYVLCVGAIKVYVYRPMLALFAAKSYAPPWEETDLDAHLTNTCLQGERTDESAVRKFWDLGEFDAGPDVTKEAIFTQICTVTGELFAAACAQPVHFQPLPGAFEVFGLDFLVDAQGSAWLLEVNAFPDFKQTGAELRDVVAEFWAGVLRLAVGPFIGLREDESPLCGEMVLVRDFDLRRG
jgi:tubulin---tyrosine ligase